MLNYGALIISPTKMCGQDSSEVHKPVLARAPPSIFLSKKLFFSFLDFDFISILVLHRIFISHKIVWTKSTNHNTLTFQ